MKIQTPEVILGILTILAISCTSKTSKQKKEDNRIPIITDRNVYDDIDLFIMKGINKIEIPNSYPYIKIDSLENDRKRVLYKISVKDSVERIYTQEHGYWATSYEFKVDTGYARMYEYVTPEKMIELGYFGTFKKTDYYFHDATVRDINGEIMYSFYGDKGIDVEPSPLNVELAKDKAKATLTEKYYFNDGILKIESSYLDKSKNEIFYSDKSCYKVGKHSWFWWRYFSIAQPIKCQ